MTAKSISSFIKRVFFGTAAIYFLTSVLIFITFFHVNELDPARSGAVNLQLYSMLFSFMCAFFTSLAGLIPRIGTALRVVINFLLCYCSMYVSFFAVTGRGRDFRSIFALSTVFLVIYAIICALCALDRKITSGKKEDNYESIYTENSDNN